MPQTEGMINPGQSCALIPQGMGLGQTNKRTCIRHSLEARGDISKVGSDGQHQGPAQMAARR